eukprot:4707612-Pleurochrysis_carterae.AAC.2
MAHCVQRGQTDGRPVSSVSQRLLHSMLGAMGTECEASERGGTRDGKSERAAAESELPPRLGFVCNRAHIRNAVTSAVCSFVSAAFGYSDNAWLFLRQARASDPNLGDEIWLTSSSYIQPTSCAAAILVLVNTSIRRYGLQPS